MAGSRKKRNQELLPQHDPRAPLDSPGFLSAAQPVLSLLTADLLERADASTAVTAELRRTHAAEHTAGRTAEPYEVWRRQRMVQVAAAWLLSCVFVRVLEDRCLLARHRLAGPGAEDSQRQFGELAPYLGPRDYLLTLFRELAKLPATAPLFDARHNLVWRLAPSQGGAQALLDLLRAPQPDAPAFRFGQPDTRFLGDLYQDISADVRETYALLQTPDFVESFILDRTLDPALAEYGPDDTTLIDPTCGSGHFLLGAFARLLDAQRHHNPGHSAEAHANNALARVFGVDINPYAVAIARFRLTLAFWDAIGLRRLVSVQSARPPLNVVVGDSLFHAAGVQIDFVDMPGQASTAWYGPTFAFDDEEAAKAILGKRFAAVVGNPPYITVKDSALRETYRKRFPNSASGKYALSAPFLEQFFLLARPGGFTGQITSNAFIKREFGKKLVETVLPRFDLTLVVNTAGAYIPGHGTPTVLIFGRHRKPEGEGAEKVLAVLSKRGEPSTPVDPAKGEVWSSIVRHWHDASYNGEYISVERVDREALSTHPWSLEGGGAGRLKQLIESRSEKTLSELVSSIGFMAITGEDDAFIGPVGHWGRRGAETAWVHPLGYGEIVRDWNVGANLEVFFPYKDGKLCPPSEYPGAAKALWPLRRTLLERPDFSGKKYIDVGRVWYSFHQVPLDRLKNPLSLTFAFVATHNHFALDRGDRVFTRTAPIIKLPSDATANDHLAILAYLNSSIACFWMKQVSQQRTITTGDKVLQSDISKLAYEFTASNLNNLPMPKIFGETDCERLTLLVRISRQMDDLADCRRIRRSQLLARSLQADFSLMESAEQNEKNERKDLARQTALQEALDLAMYSEFNLIPKAYQAELDQLVRHVVDDLSVVLAPDERGFIAHSSTAPLARLSYQLSEASQDVRLIETSMFKRRWIGTQGRFQAEGASLASELRLQAKGWLEDQVEAILAQGASLLPLTTIARAIEERPRVNEICQLVDAEAPGLRKILDDLTSDVPFLAAQRYSESGLEKHDHWEQTWALQRLEDAGKKVGKIPVPPKYDVKDFRDPNYFRLRGKLDVPKERFISYPSCESDADGEPVYGWAGWDHLQRASALMDLFYKRKNDEGWTAERLTPILAGLLELLPWLTQWHNEPDTDGSRMGDDYESVLDEELRGLGLSRDKLRAWRPALGRATKAAAAKASTAVDTDDALVEETRAKHPGRSLPAANESFAAEAPKKRRGRPPRAAAEAPPGASPATAQAVPAPPPVFTELGLFPSETPAQARKRGRPKKN